MRHCLTAALAIVLGLHAPARAEPEAPRPTGPTLSEVLANATDADWRRPDPEDLVYLELPGGRVVMELATPFAPAHAANIRTLVRSGYFDGLAVLRAQENYVVQWGDPSADDADKARPLGEAAAGLAPEFDRSAADLPFHALPDGDVYAPQVGFSHGFAAARDPANDRAWLAHCPGSLGVARGNTADSGSGAGLYVVIGHGPRHLDRNITLVGRVLKGMELLSVMPRGTGALGFYQDAGLRTPILSMSVAADVPPAQRSELQVFRTDTEAFAQLVASRRHRFEPWFLDPVGRVELCNVAVPVREAPPATP